MTLLRIPNDILISIFEYIKEDEYYDLMLVCKHFYNIISYIKLNNVNLYSLCKAYDNRIYIKKEKNTINLGGKMYNHEYIYKKYGGIWNKELKEWSFNNYKILFYLENYLKNKNIYDLYNCLNICKIKHNNYIINTLKRFNFKNLYQYYLHIKKRYKYNINCQYCSNGNVCELCIDSCCNKMYYSDNFEGFSFIYKCIEHGDIKQRYDKTVLLHNFECNEEYRKHFTKTSVLIKNYYEDDNEDEIEISNLSEEWKKLDEIDENTEESLNSSIYIFERIIDLGTKNETFD